MDIAEFLLARIAEDEETASHGDGGLLDEGGHWDRRRVLAECEAKRRIVEAESRWRRAKDNVIESETRKVPDDTVRVIWDEGDGHLHEESMTQQEFHDRFTEPAPPSDTLRFLALPYADHPDYDAEWSPLAATPSG